VKGQALDLCQELFVADGARSEEEDAVLQNLRKLLEQFGQKNSRSNEGAEFTRCSVWLNITPWLISR